MTSKRRRTLFLLVTIGVVLIMIGLFQAGFRGWPQWTVLAGAIVAQSSVFCLWDPSRKSAPAIDLQNSNDSLDSKQQRFEEWQQLQLEELEIQKEMLDERQRDLAHRFATYHEFLEYPSAASELNSAEKTPSRLSEHDREVHALLETEAERVYEKIRNNGYTVDGSVDLDGIRAEVLELVHRVAKIYSPESTNPLLETSFEQLARSASRICLHSLVLLERLPLDVKKYNINEMYGYLRKAVQGYGTYQQIAPWMKHLSRGAYIGRLAAGTNPVSLGAWWLATEVGRRGAQKLVEHVVDRQAVAVLHDIVTVIGVEVASVYGPGYRQRDAAWVYGAELTELLRRFPVSRESLAEALREITVLPLRSEYDRIYLYRCVANHRPSGFRISDPTMVARAERDDIADRLEAFFTKFIHGANEKETSGWREDVESRLDLKLKLDQRDVRPPTDTQAIAAVTSLHAFLTSVAGVNSQTATTLVGQTDLMTRIPLEHRTSLLNSLTSTETRFEPPDLDPSAEITECFLVTMMETLVSVHDWSSHVEELALETICYFRRSRDEAAAMFDAACRRQLARRSQGDLKLSALNSDQVRHVLQSLGTADPLIAVFRNVSLRQGADLIEQPDAVLVAVATSDGSGVRLSLLSGRGQDEAVWSCDGLCQVSRRKGFLIDDCELTGGTWHDAATASPEAIVLAGSITTGGFEKMFAVLPGRTSE